jgi:hypothetical protein
MHKDYELKFSKLIPLINTIKLVVKMSDDLKLDANLTYFVGETRYNYAA